MSAAINTRQRVNAGNGENPPALPLQASKPGRQFRRSGRLGACVYCHGRRCKCDRIDGKIPCTSCEKAGIVECLPWQIIPRQSPPRSHPSSSISRPPAKQTTPAAAAILAIPATPATGATQASPAEPAGLTSPATMPPSHQVRGHQRTAQEQADYEARNRFPEFVRQLTLRGQWAARQTGFGSTNEPLYHIPSGETRNIRDFVRAERVTSFIREQYQPAQRSSMQSFAEIEAKEEVVDGNFDGSATRTLQPEQIVQLADDNAVAILEQTNIFSSPDVEIPPSNATPLTQVQVAGQELVSKNKKRRRPKQKAKQVIDLELAETAQCSVSPYSTPAPSTATASFQSTTVENDDEDGTSTVRSTPPPTVVTPSSIGGADTEKPPRKKGKKNRGRNPRPSVKDGGLLPDQGERHYEDQPFLLCCKRITVPHPVNDHDHGDLMTLAQRVAGMLPDEIVVGPKAEYGVVWCDFNIVFGLAYHIRACGDRGINLYGTDNWGSGEVTEILVQAPETVSSVEAPGVQIECLVRQRHGVDFVYYGYDSHAFTIFEVQWQAQGEAKSREVIRKLCEDTGRDFAQTLRKYRIEKLYMHL
ncbi:hypothetical protein ONS95_014950 [Cadophora gregata]|uniref:uncharacterized protein n=1 Tax=Cadophora gregata TaxID=51156 RepID=UPI0026DC8DAB|nr:uncharacterized protein ONS95_014950 [Cadophora gregata]KAK0103150.1 hypothetical protein ONS96_005759 [Cadophora gregata f. sp. sojae]KAK0113254.1 hypothetical protein ONS95_014950 [Cadophora gregata]